MTTSIFVLASEPVSGKAVVALGLLAAMSRRTGKLGVFRPVAHVTESEATFMSALRTQAGVELTVWSGTDLPTVETASREGWWDRLCKEVVERYHATAETLDMVLIIGTDFSDAASGRSLDLNATLARDMGAPILMVESGFQRSVEEIATVASMHRSVLDRYGGALVGTVVNRVSPALVDEMKAEAASWDDAGFTGVIPEDEDLAAPSLGSIVSALNAELIVGTEEDLMRRDVHSVHVGAMGGLKMLERLMPEGSVVITAGDRTDVILACSLAQATASGPHLSALILTGGVPLDPEMMRLLSEFPAGRLPVLAVPDNTLKTAQAILELRPRISASGPAKALRAVTVVGDALDVDALVDLVEDGSLTGTTPAMFEYQLLVRARQNKRHIVLPEGIEPRILKAAAVLREREIADLTLLGPVQEVRRKIRELNLDLSDVPILDPTTDPLRERLAEAYFEARKHKGIHRDEAFERLADVSYFGTMMVHLGLADGMVSGSIHTTGHTIRPALQVIKTKPGSSVVSSVFFMAMPDRVLVYGDCAVNPNPTPEQLAVIAVDSAGTAQRFGVEPRVALLSYSTGASGSGTDVDAVRQATAIARQAAPELLIEGPIQYDAAISPRVAKTKMPESEVAGRATVFIFPDLNTGNNTYKAVQRSTGALAIGPVLQGLNKPINDLSRGCTVADIINTVAVTAIQAQP